MPCLAMARPRPSSGKGNHYLEDGRIVFRPFRAILDIRYKTQGGDTFAALTVSCPGLSCGGPFGARFSPRPTQRWGKERLPAEALATNLALHGDELRGGGRAPPLSRSDPQAAGALSRSDPQAAGAFSRSDLVRSTLSRSDPPATTSTVTTVRYDASVTAMGISSPDRKQLAAMQPPSIASTAGREVAVRLPFVRTHRVGRALRAMGFPPSD
jgi:hypothetical protein